MTLGKVGKEKDESNDSDSRPECYRNDTKVSTSALKESLISSSLKVQMAGNQPQSLILQVATRQHGTNSQPGKGPDWEGSPPLDSLGLGLGLRPRIFRVCGPAWVQTSQHPQQP